MTRSGEMGERPDRNSPEAWRVTSEHQLLRQDIHTVVNYCNEHQTESSGAKFDNEGPVTIVAYFTGDLASHHQTLQALVENPDRVVVEHSPYSKVELDTIFEAIRHMMAEDAPHYRVVGCGARVEGWVAVTVRTGQTDFAAELRGRFGPAVKVDFGEPSVTFGPPEQPR